MMVAGQNQVVMKYLRTLPSDECAEVREQLIKNLECTLFSSFFFFVVFKYFSNPTTTKKEAC